MSEWYTGRKGSVVGRLAVRLNRFRNHRGIIADGFKSLIVKYEGIPFHVYEHRSGKPPLVMLHGFLDSAQTFRRMFRRLRGRFDLYSIDTPGFGYSALPAIRELWDIRSFARSLARLVRFELKLDRPLLLSHSMGGLVAAHMTEYMRRVFDEPMFERMHMVAPGLLKLKSQERDTRRRLLYPRTADEIRVLLGALYHEEIPELSDLILDGLLREWTNLGYFYLAENTVDEENTVFFTTARLKALKSPPVLYWGKHDPITPLELARRIKNAVPGTRLVEFENASHALHIEIPDELSEAFLRQTKSN